MLGAALAAWCAAAPGQQTGAESSTAPGSETATTAGQEMARVRFINAITGGQPVAIQLGTAPLFEQVPAARPSPLKTVAPAQPGAEGRKLRLVPSGGGAPIESGQTFEFRDPNKDYTITASPGEDGMPELRVIETVRLKPDDGDAELTLINLVPDVRALDLFVNDRKLHAGVNYRGHNGPDDIKPGRYNLSVKTNDRKVVMEPTPVDLEAGKSYTVVSMGTLAGGIETLVLENSAEALFAAEVSRDIKARASTRAPGAGQAVTTGTATPPR